ncbi:1,2-dihydroxycyclohexa-3,5-diene-1-carboxylate dehydrogenase [Plasticicumulans lactativorans]|uniref:1,2-dihydroxycyclohexa-3,5-diene-1-carboxylate dehydrogenase n=1 Tax=Plasticicumulans lactativorans TaxID=1133106 RepID=A0A4R2L630_9GAMM|nr:1,6-dihydroxycyclohexa-2,4-diene-1-carboxylate dehydrogenase [Plasticicumulans lactativorans]TCO81315.1 1,2-dihydroxycyclohexa-3,5-diene-1-carboxylate dehydrogenase [Plasticicumulans lactativorans]
MVHAGRFNGKVAVVTGAAQGIGRTVAVAMAREGARLALVDRSALTAEVEAEIVAAGGEALAISADLERYDDACQALASAHARFGHIDILINNVGGTIWAKPFEHYAEHEIEAEVRRSLFPTLWGCRAALPYLVARQRGVIVNVSSVATRGVNRVPYGAAKGGVNALTACLAFEYAAQGIRVVAVAPGGTEAPPRRIPRNAAQPSAQEQAWYQQIVDQTVESSLMKRYGTLEEQAAPILFLASDEASYLTGVVLPVAGGDLG